MQDLRLLSTFKGRFFAKFVFQAKSKTTILYLHFPKNNSILKNLKCARVIDKNVFSNKSQNSAKVL